MGLIDPEDLHVPEGFITKNGRAAARVADDPNNPLAERVVAGALAVATVPLSGAEEIGRDLLNVPYNFLKFVNSADQSFSKARKATNGLDKATEISRGVGSVCFAIVVGCSVAIPGASFEESPTVNFLGRLAGGRVPPSAAVPIAKGGVQANKAAGDAWEAEVIDNVLPETQTNIRPQITIKSNGPSGLKTRLDAVGQDIQSGDTVLSEMKGSAQAPLTPNQRTVHPELETHGGVVVGKGKAPYVGGTQIPPTKVNVIRPPDDHP